MRESCWRHKLSNNCYFNKELQSPEGGWNGNISANLFMRRCGGSSTAVKLGRARYVCRQSSSEILTEDSSLMDSRPLKEMTQILSESRRLADRAVERWRCSHRGSYYLSLQQSSKRAVFHPANVMCLKCMCMKVSFRCQMCHIYHFVVFCLLLHSNKRWMYM